MRILALDPGGTTGAAWVDLKSGTDLVSTGELATEIDVYNLLMHDDMYWDLVVYESFHWQAQRKVDFRPIEVIGVMKLAQKQRKFRMTSQKPSTGKGFWTNEKLKQVDCYVVGSEHERDATRHLLHHITFTMKDTRFVRRMKG